MVATGGLGWAKMGEGKWEAQVSRYEMSISRELKAQHWEYGQ